MLIVSRKKNLSLSAHFLFFVLSFLCYDLKDPYENFYLVLEGSKTFTLFPPIEFYCMHESRFKRSKYNQDPITKSWKIESLEGEEKIPWIPIDPLKPDFERYPRFSFAREMKVKLGQGDLLYLPSLWYHHVVQEKMSELGLVVACNWW